MESVTLGLVAAALVYAFPAFLVGGVVGAAVGAESPIVKWQPVTIILEPTR